MGLLDNTDDPTMALAMGLLGSGGYSRMPVSTGQGLAAGYGAYQDAKKQQQAQQQSREMFDIQKQQHQMQLIQMQRAQQEQDAIKLQIKNYVDSLPEDNPQKAQIVQAVQMGVPMKDVWDKLNPKQEAYTLTPGAQRFGSNNVPLASVPVKPDPLPWYVQKGPNGTQIDPAYAAFEKSKALAGRPATPFFQAVSTPNGVMSFDARSGKMNPVDVGGSSVMKASDSPELQGRISQAKESGKVTGETITKAGFDLPQAIAQGEQTVKLVDDLLKSPGMQTAVGLSSKIDPRNYIPGTDAKDFGIRLDQLKGQQFMQAYQSLKGGGQITEVEGKKATDAISRMNTSASEKEFVDAAREFQGIIRQGMNRAKLRAGNVSTPIQSPAQSQPSGVKFLGFE